MLSLRCLDEASDQSALQLVLENAQTYALRVSGLPQAESAAAAIFTALPPGFQKSKKFVLGIFENSTLIGCMDVLRGFPTEEAAHIGLLLLREDKQASGFGRDSYALLEKFMKSWTEIKVLRLSVVATNGEVIPFWRKMGFQETGERRPYQDGTVSSEAIILKKAF